jgi:cell wall-associated NlpC family hydrolase
MAVTDEERVVVLRLTWAPVRVLAVTSAGVALSVASAGLADAATAAATTTVNIRSGPGTSYAVVGGLVRGQRVSTTSRPRAGWVAVAFGGRTAYIAATYVDSTGALPARPTRIEPAGVKIATETLNVRSGPGAGRTLVGTIAEGRRLTLTGRQSGGYAQTGYRGHDRWVSVAYLASTPGGRTTASAPAPVAAPSKGRAALAFAQRQLGKPYRFGAVGPSSFDCSGLTLAAWRSAGVSLPRTSQQQYRQGRRIAKSQLRPGDLVFFYSQSPSHVGIYVGNGMIIHAPRPGRSVEYTKMSYMPYAGAVRPG